MMPVKPRTDGRSRPGLWSVMGLVLLVSTPTRGEEPPILPVGYDAFRQWDRWPYQRIGERAFMRSTYDRAGGNEAADASHFLYQPAEDRNVTLDLAGPGIVYFVRYNHWHGSPWHDEIDGIDHVVRDTSTADPLHPALESAMLPQAAFAAALAPGWAETRGADLSWIPMGFTRSFRMAYERSFYGTGYYIYHQFVPGIPLSQPIAAWDESPPPADVLDLIGRIGTDLAPAIGLGGTVEHAARVDLAASGTMAVWAEAAGPEMLRLLEFSVPRAAAEAFSEARLRVTWDDRAWPSIDAPIGLFFGAGILYNRDERPYLVKSLPMTVRYDRERVTLDCWFPMPFFRSARIELVGAGQPVRDVAWRLRTMPYVDPPNQVGYFHATYRDHALTPSAGLGADLVLLDTRRAEGGGDWSGSFVGTAFTFSDHAVLDTLEGDPRFFFDDSLTPEAQGTGTEEWAGGGDYWGGRTMTLPFVGHPAGAQDARHAQAPEDAIESAYRFLLSDLMPFGRNALIQLEHGGEDRSTEHYRTVAYWYGLPAASLIPTDMLAIGDAASEVAHGYASPDASPPYAITSRYEWGPETLDGREIYSATTDHGRTMTNVSRFTLRIDPANFGVMLRRKLDYAFPNQRARVSVAAADGSAPDWQPAGIWYLAGSNTDVFSAPRDELGPAEHVVQTSDRRFRDDDFLLPRALTAGRTAIRLRIEFLPMAMPLFPGHPVPDLAWSELRYTAYSFVMPRFNSK
jgi:hypothetical protein